MGRSAPPGTTVPTQPPSVLSAAPTAAGQPLAEAAAESKSAPEAFQAPSPDQPSAGGPAVAAANQTGGGVPGEAAALPAAPAVPATPAAEGAVAEALAEGAGPGAGEPAAAAGAAPSESAGGESAAGATPAAVEGGEAEGGGEAQGEAEMEARLATAGGGSAGAAPPTAGASEGEPGGDEGPEESTAAETDAEAESAIRDLVPPETEAGGGSGTASGTGSKAIPRAGGGAPPALEAAESEADSAVREERAAEDSEAQAETESESRAEQAVPPGLATGAPGLAETPPEPETEPESGTEAGLQTAEPAAETSGTLNPAERGVALSALAEGGGGGGEGGGGGGGGGGAVPEPPEPAVPDLSGADPQSAMGTLATLEPAAAIQAVSGVGAAVGTSVGAERDALAESPPEVPRSYGLAPAEGSASEAAAAAPVAEGPESVPETPEGAPVPVPAPEPLPTPPPPPTQSLPAPRVEGGEGGEMSAADAERLRDSVDGLPTQDPGLDTSAGPPPALELAGDADPGQMQAQQAELDRTMVEARAQGARDAAVPMGEDRILPLRQGSAETLKATIPAGGSAAAGASGGGEVPPEAAGIIAKECSGAELASAAQKAQSDMAARQSEHRTRVASERAKSDAEIAALETTAAGDQAGEQRRAQGEVEGLRGEWSEAQSAAVESRSAEAETARAEGDGAVAEERAAGETEAAGHIETGEGEAAQARAAGESEAETEKAKAKEESSGVFGWLASKAKAFFDGIKKGIQKAFEKARAAVKSAIEKAKKLAVAAIEKARSAIIAAIRKVGDALIAIGDRLLADFPGLRDRFRKAIQEKVAAAEAAVNRIADGLKAGVQKALDLLGGALDAALGLLEKGLLFVVDAYSAAVQGALKAAQAVADALGMFAALITDIAAGPGQWIANLASGVMDGIRNHLWKAFKSAVQNWFNQKVEEVLGLGTALWGLLTKGGMALAEIGKMAWEALKAAIPPTLIALLIEKLVSMIVPAAGAVMAIIEGLQAAWGSVSRIIAAAGAFFAFLRAVKPGTAGPAFAGAMAAGAVVVIDFVANWLLRRLRKPAGKVAGKLKAIGKKILAKLKKAAKKVGGKLKRAAKKVVAKLKGAAAKIKAKLKRKKKGTKPAKGGKEKPKKKSKEEKARERLEKAQRELTPKIDALLAKGVSGIAMRARLLMWRVQYRLSRLEIVGSGDRRTIRATVNPSLDLVRQLLAAEGPKLSKMIRDIGRRLLFKREDVRAAMGKIAEQRAKGRGKTPDAPIEPEAGGAGSAGMSADVSRFPSGEKAKDVSKLPPGTAREKGTTEHISVAGQTVAERQTYSPGAGHIETQFPGHSGSYADIRKELDAVKAATGKSDADLAKALIAAQQTGQFPPELAGFPNLASLMRLHTVERGRSSAHVVTDALGLELMAEGKMTTGEYYSEKRNPMVGEGAVARASQASADVGVGHEREYSGGRSATKADVQKLMDMELDLMTNYVYSKLAVDKPLVRDAAQLERLIKKELEDYIEDMVELQMFGVGGAK